MLTADMIQKAETIVKMFDFKISSDETELIDRITEYMKIQRLFFGKEVFVFINLKNCFSENELESFYQWVFYNKFKAIIIEGFQRNIPLKEEKNGNY